MIRPDVLLLVLPPLAVMVAWLVRPLWDGWDWELPEGESGGRLTGAARLETSPPSESSWPPLPAGWTAADVELTLMDIEYAEAYRG